MEREQREEVLASRRLSRKWTGMLAAYYTQDEIDAVLRSIEDSMDFTVGFGGGSCAEIEDFEAAYAEYCGTAECVAVNAAGTGMDMAVMCLDLEPGDEVIIPAVNFKASALGVIAQGGQVVWCEVDPRTLQADPEDVLRRLTPRTRALYPTHMNGLSAPMAELLEIAEANPHPKHGPLQVIGDAARACGAGYRGGKVGKLGWMNVFSFHTAKNMTTLGEGGAITTDDPEAAARLRLIRQWGGPEGWGSNYKMTKTQAAVGLVQLARLEQMNQERRQVALERATMLEGLEEVFPPYEPPDCVHTWLPYTCLVQREWAGERRDRLIAIMREEFDVICYVQNGPAYLDGSFVARHTEGQRLPLAEDLGRRIFTLPIHPLMPPEDNEYICAALWETVDRLRGEG